MNHTEPLVTIIICTYLEQNQKYLDLAFNSINRQTHKNIEVVLVSSSRSKPVVRCIHPVHKVHSEERWHYPRAVFEGYKQVKENSEFILLLNDDAFMHESCIEDLVNGMGDSEMILNPLSPCSNAAFYYARIGFIDERGMLIPIKQQNVYEEIAPYADRIMTHAYRYPPLIFFTTFSPFFCTLIKKKTWDKIGGIDPTFKTGQDDLDFGIRAARMGIRCATLASAFVMHFSGRSASSSLTDEDREFNINYFNQKHGHKPF